MSIKTLQKITQRIRAMNKGKRVFSDSDLKVAIGVECGKSRGAFFDNRYALIKLGWIKQKKKLSKYPVKGKKFIITGKDLKHDEDWPAISWFKP